MRDYGRLRKMFMIDVGVIWRKWILERDLLSELARTGRTPDARHRNKGHDHRITSSLPYVQIPIIVQ